jgi:WD40 repeat protein
MVRGEMNRFTCAGAKLNTVLLLQNHEIDACGIRAAQLLQDTLQILQLYGVPIRSHALHLYHSVLVTMPSCPLLDALVQEHVPDSAPRLLSPRATHLGPAARVLVGHKDWVVSVAYSPNGTRIVSGSHDRTIRVWSAITYEELGRIEGHTKSVTSLVYSPDGSRIVSGSSDRTVRVWSANDLKHLATLEGHQQTVCAVAVSPDGTRIMSASLDGSVFVWCASRFAQLAQMEYSPSVVTFSPKGDRIISLRHAVIRIFNAFSFECLAELDATVYRVPMTRGFFCSAALSHDGKRIFAGTTTGLVRVWCADTFRELGTLDQEVGSDVDRLAVSSDGTLVLSGDAKTGVIHVWNAQTYTKVVRFHAHRFGLICVTFSLDGARFVSSGNDSMLRVWVTGAYDEDTGASVPNQINFLEFSADGAHIIARSQQPEIFGGIEPWMTRFGRRSTVRLWRVNNFPKLDQLEPPSLFAFSPDGARAVVYDQGGALRVCDLSVTEKPSILLKSDGSERIESITYSPDGTSILCGMSEGIIESWSPSTYEKLSEFEAHSTPVLLVLFSSNGTRLVSRSFGEGIRVWAADTSEKMGEIAFHNTRIECVAVSPMGTRVIVGLRDRTVRVWSAVTFHELANLRPDGPLLLRNEPPQHIAFSPDGWSVLIMYILGETRTWTSSEDDECASAFYPPSALFADLKNTAVWTEGPLSPVQLPTDATAGAWGVSLSTSGWLRCWIRYQPRMIWLPHNRRSTVYKTDFATIGERVAALADNGTLTVLAFSAGKQ